MPYIVAAALSAIPTGGQLIKALCFIISSFLLVPFPDPNPETNDPLPILTMPSTCELRATIF